MRVPLNAIDEAFVNAVDPAAPFSNEVEVRLKGRLDISKLRAGIDRMLDSHPMTGARLVKAGAIDWTHSWDLTGKLDEDPLQIIETEDDELDGLRERLQSVDVSVQRAPPFRLWLIRLASADVLLLNVAHAALDGISCLRMLCSLDRFTSDRDDPAPCVDPIRARMLEPLFANWWTTGAMRRLAAPFGQHLQAWLEPAARVARVGGVEKAGYGIHHVTVPAASLARVARRHALSATTNDLALGMLSRTIERWNTDHGEAAGRISVLVPVNLRPREWARDVMGNLSLAAYVSTDARDRVDGRRLLACIVEQTAQIKRDPSAATLVDLCALSALTPAAWKSVPGWLTPMALRRTAPTTALTNLGRWSEPFSFGSDAPAECIWASPPCRMPMGLVLGAIEHRGTVHFSFRFRHAQMSSRAARAFADAFIASVAYFS
jgi:NRPS condensation-like uncharacterized protein